MCLKQTVKACALSFAVLAAPLAAACDLTEQQQNQINRSLDAAALVSYDGTILLEQNQRRQYVEVSADPSKDFAQLRRLSVAPNLRPETLPALHHRVADACELETHYRLTVEQGATTAGLATYRVIARPRDSLRFGYIMDVDRQTGLPLRVVTATQDGAILERYEFAEIAIGEPFPSPDLEPPTVSASHFRLAQLPPGFQLVGHSDQPVETLVISDGLAAASIFVEPTAQALKPGEGAVLRGSTLSYSRGLTSARGSALITVIGEVPIQTARLLADAVRPFEPRIEPGQLELEQRGNAN